MAKTKYYAVFNVGGRDKNEIGVKKNYYVWRILTSGENFPFMQCKPTTNKESLKDLCRVCRENNRISQSYSRNPVKMKESYFVHEVDESGKYIPSKKEKDDAITWAKNNARESVSFEMENAEFLARLSN
jgi:hypothetical protein